MKVFRKLAKPIAIVLCLAYLFIHVEEARALTAGPTSPEFTSFEPVDTSENVDLSTGDFSYNIPLFEVPGPQGGYPVSMSYHAGIKPGQESSWVGLGWSLSPGAINRYVNGIADDLHSNMTTTRDVWEGGDTKSFSVGVGFGAVNAGISIATDTYKGVGMGYNFSAGPHQESPLRIGLSVAPYNVAPKFSASLKTSSTMKIGSAGFASQGASVGLSYSLKDNNLKGYIDGGLKLGLKNGHGNKAGKRLVGLSMSTEGGGGASLSGILAESINSNAGQSSSYSTGFSVPIPIGSVMLSLGFNKTRYWLNQADFVNGYGSLHPKHTPVTITEDVSDVKTTYDCFPLVDPNASEGMNSDPNKSMGGSLPAYDSYQVTGQGIGGMLTPYMTEVGQLYRQNIENEDEDIDLKFYPDNNTYRNNPSFRFSGAFSNALVRTPHFEDGQAVSQVINQDMHSTVGLSGQPATQSTSDFNWNTGELKSGRHIQTFTNREIREGVASNRGLVDYALNRDDIVSATNTYNIDDQIGAFVLTNTSGVTYHYALPVYSFDDYSKSINTKNESYRSTQQTHPYAYTWLLTAITGPDYEDHGIQGILDESDKGYWVKFDYGKWSDHYGWRTPDTDFQRDLDNEVKMYSGGFKQIYYLDAIKTKSHTALFIKSERPDAKGVMDIHEGGFGAQGDKVSVAALKLEEILLFTNKGLDKAINDLTSDDFKYEDLRNRSSQLNVSGTISGQPIDLMSGDGVLDIHDLHGIQDSFEAKALSQNKLIYDSHGLGPGTPNSFDMDYEELQKGPLKGKLALTEIEKRGLNRTKALPNTKFQYAKNPAYNKDKVDMWGYYKSDLHENDDKLPKETSIESAQNVDAWSLTQITTPLGAAIEISYEADDYETSVLSPWRNYAIEQFDRTGLSSFEIEVHTTQDLSQLDDAAIGTSVEIRCLVGEPSTYDYTGPNGECVPVAYDFRNETFNATIVGTNENKITLSTNMLNLNPLFNSVTTYDCEGFPISDSVRRFAGNIIFHNPTDRQGGGLRTKSIAFVYGDNIRTTHYEYSGGVTSYEPVDFNIYVDRLEDYSGTWGLAEKNENNAAKKYKDAFFEQFKPILANSQLLPSPGVIYSQVHMTETLHDKNAGTTSTIPGSKQFNFRTFQNTDVERDFDNYVLHDGTKVRVVKFDRQVTGIGTLRKTTTFSKEGEVLNETINRHLDDIANVDDRDDFLEEYLHNQGRLDQMFYEKRSFNGEGQLMVTLLNDYPDVTLSNQSVDNVLGFQSRTDLLAYDFYTGAPRKTLVSANNGLAKLTVTSPAHEQFSSMGAKFHSHANEHMLSQEGLSYDLLLESTIAFDQKDFPQKGLVGFDTLGLSNAAISTWTNKVSPEKNPSQISDQWKIHKQYEYVGAMGSQLIDGTLSLEDFDPEASLIVSGNGGTPDGWELISEITEFNDNAEAMEMKDQRGKYSAILFDPEGDEVIAKGTFCQREELAFSGAEFYEGFDRSEGQVSRGDGVPVNGNVHSGNFSLLVPSGSMGFEFEFTPMKLGRSYYGNVWVFMPGSSQDEMSSAVSLVAEQDGVEIARAYPEPGVQAQNRFNISLQFSDDGSQSPIKVYCENAATSRGVYFDDFRVSPAGAEVKTYVYDQLHNRIEYTLDQDNFYTRFEYNDMGQLIGRYQEIIGPKEKQDVRFRQNYANANN